MYKKVTTLCRHLLPPLLLTILVFGSCTNKTASDRSTTRIASSGTHSEQELQLPVIPDSLTRPEERAAYAAAHFWDHLDFGRDTRCLDTIFMEQNFANFLAVAAFAADDDAQHAIDHLIDSASANDDTKKLIDHIAEKYLDEPNSPMRSEELYVMFLKHIAADGNTDEAQKIRARHRLDMAMKNRVGTKATDFRLITSEGKESSLLALARNDTTLIMFYDPECEQCNIITRHLDNADIAHRYKVIAIDLASDRPLRNPAKSAMPSEWIMAFALEDIEDNDMYYLPALPSLYLIAPDGTVIMKDIPSSVF